MKKYIIEQEQYLDDLKIKAKLLKHKKSGARIVLLPADDSNKVFSIAFKTAPIDNAGISHILEHSVLCGSSKYPLKEPFVELLKGSLNTFLNAFTFSDKTMYPVASKNEKDFKNLMSVYMDAVFNPQIYNHEEIFLQEGWRYEINSLEEDIKYNGVVYNEMKGAFSSADSCLEDAISRSLYPDNCYGLVSGGDPKYIPTLSYQKFLDFHKKLYHPSNSYIVLYGNMDMEERLDWLDEAYLSKYDTEEIISRIDIQKPFEAPVDVLDYYPIGEKDDATDKYYFSYNVCYKNTLDVKTTIGLETLVNVLFNVPGAKVKEALIKKNIGTEVYASYRSDYFQPMISIVVKGAKKDSKKEFIQTLEESLKEIVKNGVDKETIISTLDFSEFKTREAKFNMPKGLVYGINLFTSWLYDDTKPFLYADTLKFYPEFKKDLDNHYFEDLILDAILNNNHKSYVTLVPSHTLQKKSDEELALKLKEYKESLSEGEILSLIEKNKKLKEYQSTPDSEEVLNTLPKLELKDISRSPEKLNVKKSKIGNIPYYFSDYNTNDIMYLSYMFDVSKISNNEVQFMCLLTYLYGYMSTKNMTYAEISNKCNSLTGGVFFNLDVITKKDSTDVFYFTVKYSCIEENLEKTNNLIKDILFNTKLNDKVRLKEILNELKGEIEMSITQSGHVYASKRAAACATRRGLFNELIDGISFYDFLSNLVANFDSLSDDLINKLENISSSFMGQDNLLLHLVADEKLSSALKKNNLIDSINEKSGLNGEFSFIPLENKTAFYAPIDVNYVALVGSIGKENYNGSSQVIKNVISNSYLWQVVRVKGGAYGCFMSISSQGNYIFTSYRDGNIKSTLDAYFNTPKFIKDYNPTEDEFAKVKIGAIGAIDDAPHVETLGRRALSMELTGYTYSDLKKEREELLDATIDDFKAFASSLEEGLKKSYIAVIGSEKIINENKTLFNDVVKLTK